MNIRSCIELTNLKPDIREEDVIQLLNQASDLEFHGVCLPPFWIKKANRDRPSERIRLVTVIGFPMGWNRTEVKLKELDQAILDGADELDMVWNLSAFKSGMNWAKIELAKAANLCHSQQRVLKVILETALLTNDELLNGLKICSDAGVDFVKTSTGFLGEGAQVEVIKLMRRNLSDQIGIKASGGIRTLEQALVLVDAGADRIGASGAADWFS